MNIADEQHATLRLNTINGLSPSHISLLLGEYGSAFEAVRAGPESWRKIVKEDELIDWVLSEYENTERETNEDWENIQRNKIRLYLLHQGPYPVLLKELFMPPPILFVSGDDISEVGLAVALVGSRRCSYYGEKMARSLSRDLAHMGIVTVSGLARGIDSAVHDETLKAGGRTWAVLGCGLSRCYPPENRKLYDRVSENGAVISEFPLRRQPFPGNFPRRNRIIAGLTFGTVVVEGTEKSGSLITARLAAREGREVFAVPGPATSLLSSASHYLIQSGAKLVRHAGDIAEELPEPWRGKWRADVRKVLSAEPDLPPVFKTILGHLQEGPVPKEILAQRLHTPSSELAALLFDMEIRGIVRSLPGGLLVMA